MGKNGNKNGYVSLPISLAKIQKGLRLQSLLRVLEFVILCYYSAYV